MRLQEAFLLLCFTMRSHSSTDQEGTDSQNNRQVMIGIDIGSSHVRVGVFQKSQVTVLKNDQGVELTPSYVAFTSGGHRLIGDEAKSQLSTNPRNTIFSVQPFLGRKFDSDEVQEHIKHMPYTVLNRDGRPVISAQIGNQTESFSPEEIVAMLLRKMKKIAERFLNATVTGAVISVPGCFTYLQRMAMRDAAKIAGLDDFKIVNAAEAAAVAYLYLNPDKDINKGIMVFDVGSSCPTAAVAKMTKGAVEVEAHGAGLCKTGSWGLEQRLVDHLMEQIKGRSGKAVVKKLTKDTVAMQKLRREAERAVRSLSLETQSQVVLDLQDLFDGGPDFLEVLTRSQFESLNIDLFRDMMKLVKVTLNDAGRRLDEIHRVIMTGGASRIPTIRKLVTRHFNGSQEPGPRDMLDPDRVSAIGAAIQAGFLDGSSGADRLAVLTICPETVGFLDVGRTFAAMLHRNDVLPASRDKATSLAIDAGGAVSDEAAKITVQIHGEGGQGGKHYLIGQVSVDLPLMPSSTETDVWIKFLMKQFSVLNVTVNEFVSGAEKSVEFNHRLSQFRMQKLRRRLRDMDIADERERRRLLARDSLESLIYRSWTAQKAASLSRVTEWLEANGDDADSEAFEAKASELLASMP